MSDAGSQQPSGDVKTEPPSSSSSSSNGGMSRRRITFRPYSIAPSNSTTQPSTSVQTAEPEQTGASTPTSNQVMGKTTRKWGQWSNAEISVFYEGVKQYGKDFEQVARLMSRRKMNKDKEQIRNYYFNSFKLIRSNAQIEEELMADVPRDARELFIVINGFEWKKRTGDGKYDTAKLRQLIFEGSTSVRSKKKKQSQIVRTPFCPALQKLFPSRKLEEPLPTHVTICLTPKLQADKIYVESCDQNPFLRVRVSVSDHLSRLFTLLKKKWIPKLRKIDPELEVDEEPLNLVLFPDKSMQLGRVLVKCTEESTPTAFSLNRLKRERNRPAVEECDEGSNQEDALAAAAHCCSSDSNHSEAFPTEVPNSLYSESSAFVINEFKLRAGLTEATVGDASVTELFYLCGMKPEIRLEYSTNKKPDTNAEPWNIFVSLISRNYGENLCKYLAEPEVAGEARQVMVTVEDRNRKRRASSSASNDTTNPPAKTSAGQTAAAVVSTSESTQPAAPSSSSTTVVCDQVVELENNAFMQQLESLQTKKRTKSFAKRAPSKRIIIRDPGIPYSAPSSSYCSPNIYAPANMMHAMYEGDYHMVTDISDLQAQQNAMAHPVDFSSIAATSNHVDASRTPEHTHPCGSFVGTPNAQFAAQVLTSMSGQNHVCTVMTIDQEQGAFSSHCGGVEQRQGTPHAEISEAEEKTLTELSAVEVGGSSLDMSPMKTVSNLPEDVRHSFEMMMQQNSVDYCRNFEQLLTSIDTPKKNT